MYENICVINVYNAYIPNLQMGFVALDEDENDALLQYYMAGAFPEINTLKAYYQANLVVLQALLGK